VSSLRRWYLGVIRLMPVTQLEELVALPSSVRIYDLAFELHSGIPHFPTHPPFVFGLTKRHGEVVTKLADGRVSSSSAESIATGTHVGTHLDGLGHFSCNGVLFGGVSASEQSYETGLPTLGMETVFPILRRGVLLDIAALEGVARLETEFTITSEHLQAACSRQAIEIRTGDVVLLRTGWAQQWPDPAAYLMGGQGNVPASPGPDLDAARWLSARGIFATGSDTIIYEKAPSQLPVHVHLLVEKGIHIIEVLNLEEFSRDGISQFLFIALPLKIRGATGSPIRPIAVVL
jgi:kynurenine formamidase